MDKYEVYLHNVPKVSDDGKVVPIDPPQTHEFTDLEEAQKAAGENKDKFDRVVVIGVKDEKQRMIERYMDGEHIVPEPKPEEEPEEAQGDGDSEGDSEGDAPESADATN